MAAQGSPHLPNAQPPDWPHCGVGTAPEDPIGCRGVHVTGHNCCLAHLDDSDRATHLAGLHPGADIDHRGTPFTEELLRQLLHPLHDPEQDRPRFGHARFGGAVFSGTAGFEYAVFSGLVWFGGAVFSGAARFDRAVFSGVARFDRAVFSGVARFDRAVFSATARFGRAVFARDATFLHTVFSGAARWRLMCAGKLNMDQAVLSQPATMEIAAGRLSLRGVRVASPAVLRLRYARVDLSGAVLEQPLTVAAEPAPFWNSEEPADALGEDVTVSAGELPLSDGDPGVRVVSLSGVDASQVSLAGIDLSQCRFAGTINLDQVHLTGRTRFANPPTGWHRRGLRLEGWSRRRTLAEEHHWRAATAGAPAPGTDPGPGEWQPGQHHPDLDRTPGPETVTTLYRQLRKALEDSKDEPGAADFYYGEMEMRRHASTTSRSDKALLTAYWALSGYGLRASRALSWLGTAMAATVLLMMVWGLLAEGASQVTTGRRVEAGQDLVLATETPDPLNPTGPVGDRITTDRFEKALRVVINSTVFRSSGQDLTTAGTYIEMTSRIAEPALLALAVLAIRARVKR